MVSNSNGLSNRSASYVQAEVFWAIQELARKARCEVLKKVALKKVYLTVDKPFPAHVPPDFRNNQRIVGVYTGKKARIVKLIEDNMKKQCPFRISLDEYIQLRKLVQYYKQLEGVLTITSSKENEIQQVISEIRPNFYTAEEIIL